MKNPHSENRIRPAFAALVACALAVVIVPVWLLTRSTAPAKRPGPAPEAGEPRSARVPREIPDNWRRVTAPPRGSPVSVRALSQKPARRPASPAPSAALANLEERWGIRVHNAWLSMGSAYLNLRYDIVDLKKASRLADGRTPAYVVDDATGARLALMAPPREGCFPPTGNRLKTGKIFFTSVGNKGRLLKSGDTVTVIVGDSATTNVTID